MKKYIPDLLVILFILVVISTSVLSKPINELDEIWNYNFAKNIAEGKVPYRDFNMIQTPLLSMLCAFFLKLFGNELLVMRLLAIVFMTAIFYLVYQVLNHLIEHKNSSIFIVLLLLSMFHNLYFIDYNYANVCITLILILLEWKGKEEKPIQANFKKDLLLGVLAGIAILFKQTTGLCIAICCIGYKIFFIRKKQEWKEYFKIVFIRLVGVLVPNILFVLYLLKNHALEAFWDYAILGVKTFSNSVSYLSLFCKEWYLQLLAIAVPASFFVMLILIFSQPKDKKRVVLFSYGIASFAVTFPISDQTHFLTGSIVSIIGIAYLLKLKWSKVRTKLNPKITLYLQGAAFAMALFTIYFNIAYGYHNLQICFHQEKETQLKHFVGTIENKDLKKQILEVENYIKEQKESGKEVIILDPEAAIYFIPLDMYHQDYDMFLKGNLGSQSEEGMIQKIQKEEAIFLIKNDRVRRNWQNPEKVRNYVQRNFNKIGEISIFDIYEENLF